MEEEEVDAFEPLLTAKPAGFYLANSHKAAKGNYSSRLITNGTYNNVNKSFDSELYDHSIKVVTNGLGYGNSKELLASKAPESESVTPIFPLPATDGLISIIASRIYYSKFSAALFTFGFLLNVVTLVEGLVYTKTHEVALVAELVVTLLLVLEVSMRLLIQGHQFFQTREGCFDFTLMIGCIVLLIINMQPALGKTKNYEETEEEVSDYLELSFTAFQFAVQLLRIGSFVRRRQRTSISKEQIDFLMLQTTARNDDL